jgi:hypothetical protein
MALLTNGAAKRFVCDAMAAKAFFCLESREAQR